MECALDTVTSPNLAELQAWLTAFEARHGRKLRVLHVGNVANNAYLIAKEQQRVGIDADVLSNDYYHMMTTPEWEELDIRHDWGDDTRPVFSPDDLGSYERPRFFAQGPLIACAAYLRARWEGTSEDADLLWEVLERSRLSQQVDAKDQKVLTGYLEWLSAATPLQAAASATNPSPTSSLIEQRSVRRVPLLAATAAYRAARFTWRTSLQALRLAGLARTADKIKLRAGDNILLGKLIRQYQNLHLHVAQPEKVERFQALVDEFARFFPERTDQLSVADVAPYAYDVDLLAPVFANYDIVQGYGIGPIHPAIADVRPLIAFEHGTLRDFIRGDIYWHRLTALGYRKADHVFVTNGDCIEHARWLGCESVSPMLHPIDVKQHEVRDDAMIAELRRRYAGSVLLFCPIRHDWSVKGTDVHLRALPMLRARFGDRVKTVLSPWGQQTEESRRLIAEAGCGRNVVWLERPLCRRDLIRHLQAADVVLDQMALPHFGATAPQALAAGTPVIMSYVPESTAWLVREPAPILAAFTPQDVAECVVRAIDPGWRAAFKVRAQEWIHAHHHDRAVMEGHVQAYRSVLENGEDDGREIPGTKARKNSSYQRRGDQSNSNMNDDELLKQRYESIALTGDVTTTACDHHLRDLEIEFGLEHIRDGDAVLDVGCGPGVALRAYARRRSIDAHGIDYAGAMVDFAIRQNEQEARDLAIEIGRASVLELPYPDARFDVVTSHRCLMALLDWDKQQAALREITRVLKPGGTLVLMEGTIDGLARLNAWRARFGLSEIDPTGRDRLLTLKFSEPALLSFIEPMFEVARVQRWGMYYFLTRIVQPLLVAPDQPSYDHRLNAVAKEIARKIPDLQELGHLVGFALRKLKVRNC